MKTNIRLPYDFYENLYNEIMNYGFEPECESDTDCEMEIEIGEFQINLCATFDVEIEDMSFDHAFGTENIYELVAGNLTGITDVVIYHDDIDISDQFNYKTFWNQFRRYMVMSKGVQIHHGDTVVVKRNMRCGAWEKMIYLYTDTRMGTHVCVKSLHGDHLYKKEYRHILPATTGAIALIGKRNFHLHMDA